MGIIYVLLTSVLLQFTAAFLALRLIWITGRRRAWLFIAAGISLMAIRRSITLFHVLRGELYPDPTAEFVALATSMLMVIGVAWIAPIFLSIKRSEEELRRVNRSLKTLSECNKALPRATQEVDLLRDICRLIIEIGGYRMAWIGFAEQDEAKTVRPVAQAGYEEGYLERAKVTWSDTERGQCPVGTAIRTGLSDIARDVRTDPRLKPWRDEALKRGYRSVAGLPLFIDKKNIGALAIYAAEAEAFNTVEMELLMELVNDLAYGIKSLRISAERKRAEEALRKSEEELKKRVKELEEFYNMAVGRELRMKELKEEIESLKEKLEKYKNP